MRHKRSTALLLTAAFLTGLLGGCTADAGADTEDTEISLLTEEPDPIRIASSPFSGDFTGITTTSDADWQVVDLTTERLLRKTRSGDYVLCGIEGEMQYYNGTAYTYDGICDCTVTEREDGKVSYDFTLRDDIFFSDGTPMTADDLIFSLYVYLDPSYEGECVLQDLSVVGLYSYLKGTKRLYEILLEKGEKNKDFTYYDEETQETFFKKDWEEAKSVFMDGILAHYETDKISDVMLEMGIAELRDTGKLVTYHTYRSWNVSGGEEPTKDDLWDEMLRIAEYSNEVSLMSADLVRQGIAQQEVFSYLPDAYRVVVDTADEPVMSISGIRKRDEYSVSVVLWGPDPAALSALSVPVLSLHGCGDVGAYDYDAERFGFTKGNLSALTNTDTVPAGIGPYVFCGYEEGVVYLKANEYYWRGEAATKYVQLVETADSQMAAEVANGRLTMAQPSISKAKMEQIYAVNDNGTKSGSVLLTTLTDTSSIGYIGINAQNVSVDGDPTSDASVALRTAFCVVFAYYRFDAVYDYYGETAKVIDYPISDSSWANIRPWEDAFSYPFRTTSAGGSIYSTHSTKSEREKAVREAALTYLKNAGYVVEDGKVTEAPEGALLSYEALICGYGEGNHPSYAILQNAADALSRIGLTLTIRDVSNSEELFFACEEGTAQIFCAAWPQQEDPDEYLYPLFSENGLDNYMFSLQTASLQQNVSKARESCDPQTRKDLYRRCLQEIMQYAVMVPVYQRQNATIYCASQIKEESIPADQTQNYGWMDEIYLLRLS